jgi:hypothetical protein
MPRSAVRGEEDSTLAMTTLVMTPLMTMGVS